ncbi:unnamed protein product [Kuraishia capsulata CBS 1993]|uniref:Signal peptidase complex subunit 1 n=1 Tax=Kuraishia capsulata CBS 1993 TaxID=1382522 RepID=W6MGY8_9ASCO|nr:uncharacterized protein KUCA_T00001439001 [Kuraishia capsulata CBS 1993]CDK25469.1 unnamed protein product [Kuraishia capsulata CBS 1993]
MDQLVSKFEGNIDFKGQQLAESVSNTVLIVGSVASCLIGFVTQNVKLTCYAFAIFLILDLVIVVPPWKQYRANPVRFATSNRSIEVVN